MDFTINIYGIHRQTDAINARQSSQMYTLT